MKTLWCLRIVEFSVLLSKARKNEIEFMRISHLLLLATLLLATSNVNASYPRTLFEREPNDSPEQAQPFRGQAQLVGEVSEGDPAYFLWTLDDPETERDWTLALESEGEVRLALRRPGDTQAGSVTTFGAPSEPSPESKHLLDMVIGADQPVAELEGLIIPDGQYLLKLESDGPPVSYQLTLSLGNSLPVRRGQIGEIGGSELVAVTPRHRRTYQLDGPRHEIPLAPDTDAPEDRVWRVQMDHELGTAVEAWVENVAGEIIGERQRLLLPSQRWSGLDLEPGSRLLVAAVEEQAVGRVRVALVADGRKARQPDQSPGSRLEDALWVDLGDGVSGQVAGRQRNFFAFDVSPAQATGPLDITVAIDGDPVSACLGEVDGRGEFCRSGDDAVRFHGIWLDAGQYFLKIQAANPRFEAAYSIQMTPGEDAREGYARQPFQGRDWALPLKPNEAIVGHIEGDSAAWFELLIPTRRQQLSLAARGDALGGLRIERHGERGHVAQARARRPQTDWKIDNLVLDPGRYWIRLEGENSDFRLLAEQKGEPTGSVATEPNNTRHLANSLRPGEPLQGRLHDRSDRDYLHFHLPGWNHVLLDIAPQHGGRLAAGLRWEGVSLIWGRNLSNQQRLSQFLPPGDYYLRLDAAQGDAVEYAVELSLVDPWTWYPGVRFSNLPILATLIPPGGEVANDHSDFNVRETLLRFPLHRSSRKVQLAVEGSYQRIEIRGEDGKRLEVLEKDSEGFYNTTLPGGEQRYLAVLSRRAWSMQVDDPALPALPEEPVEMAFKLDSKQAAAWYPHVQRLAARVELVNPGEIELELPLQAHASHEGWELDGLPERVHLAPGDSEVIDIEWRLPAELSDDLPLRFYIAAGSEVAEALLAIDPEAAPLAPLVEPDFPEALAGLINLAWHGLGARFVDPDTGEEVVDRYRGSNLFPHFLIDGLSIDGISIQGGELGDALPPLRLAGNGGEVHALTFNQRSSYGPLDRWHRVEVRYSENGEHYAPLKTVELAAATGQQYFILDEPVRARYLKIRPLDTFGNRDRRHGTGLLKALGTPTAGEDAMTRTNLLDPDLGGHWVYSRPDDDRLYDFPNQRNEGRPVSITERGVEVVFAMHQHRAARIEEITWRDNLDWDGLLIESVRIDTATQSPVGPWAEQATWALDRDDDGLARLRFAEPVWARYVRLVIELPEPGPDSEDSDWRLPLAIEAFEADSLSSRSSILGYWGHYRDSGPFERQSEKPVPVASIDDSSSSPENPRPLDGTIRAQMAQPGDVRSFALTLDSPDNTLEFVLEESMSERLLLTLYDGDGSEVPVSWRSDEAGRRVGESTDRASGNYRLDVEEPPRSIMYMWDESTSVELAQPAIHRALKAAGEGLIPGEEVGNYLSLGGPPLIQGWAETPQEMMLGMARYDHRYTSSAAHKALGQVSRLMADRKGEKIIFLVTDAEFFGMDTSYWGELERVRPRIFTIEVSNGGRNDIAEHRGYQQIMRGWARVGGGRYAYTRTEEDMHRAIQRAMRLIRRPSSFTITGQTRFQEPLEDAQLTVVSGDVPVVGATAIHLIFDASGSIPGSREGGDRIDQARRIVGQILDQRLPDHVPVGLRAHGHSESSSCETELLVAPAAGNHDLVHRAVADIQATSLARTPLAASLQAVRGDLSDFSEQERLVILLIAGEETCDGDVEQAVTDLIDATSNLRLNIIGFQLDELDLQADLERFAAAGGGKYFDSQDGDELNDGLASTLAARFRLVDATGREVARSEVDAKPLIVPPGSYEIIVDTSDGERREMVHIEPGQAVEIRLSDG